MADKRIFDLTEEGFLDDITDKVYMWLDKKANEGELQEPSWKFKADVFLKILNNFATKFVPNVATVEGKCYWHNGNLFVCNVAYTGDWIPGNFTLTSVDELFARKDVLSALQTDVGNLQDALGTTNGNVTALTTYAENVAHSIAPEFDPTRTSENPYKAGESVTYTDGKTYTFTAPHYGAWTGSDVEEYKVVDDVDTAKQSIIGKSVTKSFGAETAAKETSISILKGMYFECSTVASSSYRVEVYAFKSDGTYDYYGTIAFNTSKRFLALNDYVKVRLYSSESVAVETTVSLIGVEERADELDSRIDDTNGVLSDLDVYVKGNFAEKNFEASTANRVINIGVKKDAVFELSISTTSESDGEKFYIYAYKADNTYDALSQATINVPRRYTALNDYVKIAFYKSGIEYATTASVKIFGIKDDIDNINNEITSTNNAVADINVYVKGNYAEKDFAALVANREVPIKVKEGAIFELLISTSASNNNESFETYAIKADGTYDTLTSTKINVPARYKALHDYVKIRFYKSNVDYATTASVFIYGVDDKIEELSVKPLDILILGDSYTAVAGFWRNEFLKLMPYGTVIRTTAVSSATVKDHYDDRSQYPYTSRPISTQNSGNLNTFGCQVEKLKRLMAGVDLDEGETQWYTNGTSPDVVIIAGGQNDGADSNTDSYAAQFEVTKNEVYYKETSDGELQQGSCYAKPTLEEINRKIFAGAYRYICETIKELFPKAQFFITTTSNLHYWRNGGSSKIEGIMKKGDQQRWCARACGAVLIDWQESQITSLTSCPSGSGTSDDPYILSNNGEPYSDSDDGLHPNSNGAQKLGAFMANEILKKYNNKDAFLIDD